MAIPKFLEDLNIIAKLGDNPGTDNGLSTSAFRAKFDEAALKIQQYINDVIVPAIGSQSSPEDGLKMKANIDMNNYRIVNLIAPTAANHAATKEYVDSKFASKDVVLTSDGWVDNEQTVTIDGLKANSIVIVAAGPDDENYAAYNDCGVRAIYQANTILTFKCEDIPAGDLVVNVAYRM